MSRDRVYLRHVISEHESNLLSQSRTYSNASETRRKERLKKRW